MLSLGMCIAGEQDASGTFRPIQPESARFYRELKPISDRFEQGALDAIAGSGIDRERLKTEGADPAVAMTEAARWVLDLADGRRPVFVGWPMGYDWMFLTWYFHSFSEIGSPFSFASALDMKTMVYVGTHRVLDELGKEHLPEEAGPPATAHPPRPRRRDRAGRAVPEPAPLADPRLRRPALNPPSRVVTRVCARTSGSVERWALLVGSSSSSSSP